MEISVKSFATGCAADWWGPKKVVEPVAPVRPQGQASTQATRAQYSTDLSNYQAARRTYATDHPKYLKELNVFVYNATTQIANGAVIVAVIAAVATIFTASIPAFLLAIGSSLVYYDATRELPVVFFEVRGFGGGQHLVVKADPANSEDYSDVSDHFGLTQQLFETSHWKPVDTTAFGFNIWFNTLPVVPPPAPAQT